MGLELTEAKGSRRLFRLQDLRFQPCVMIAFTTIFLGHASLGVAQSARRGASTSPRIGTAASGADDAAIAQISSALQAHNYGQALTICHTALGRTPGDPRLWSLQAIAQASTNKDAAAVVSYRRAVQIAPKYLPAWQGLAQLEYANHDPSAERTLEHVVRLAPDDAVAHAMLGALAFARKDCLAAVHEFDQARAVVGSRADVAIQWGSCLMQLDRAQEAVGVLGATLETTPADSILRYDTAVAQWKAGNAVAAQQTLDPLIHAAHPASEALALGAAIAEEKGDTQHALELLRSAILANPMNEDAYLDFARLAYEHASIQVGVDMLNIGLSKLPHDAKLYFARGVLLAQNGQIEQTMADLDRASELDPRLSFVATAQGIAASQAHQFAKAEERLREQTRQRPSDATAWYLLAEALADQPLEPESAKHAEMVHAAKEAVRLDPKSVEARVQLAAIYLRGNEAPKAMDECNAALAINPQDPQALYQLLLATRKAGRKDQIPVLIKRLMAAREAAEQKDKNSRRQTLLEIPQASGAGNNP